MTNSNKKFYSKKSFNEEDFIQITIPSGAYELESLNDEFKRNLIDKCHYTEAENPFTIKPNFSTLGSVIELSPQGAKIGFVFDDSIRNLLGFRDTMLFKKVICQIILLMFYHSIKFFSNVKLLEECFPEVTEVISFIIGQ